MEEIVKSIFGNENPDDHRDFSLVPSRGVEPLFEVPQTSVLSIELQGQSLVYTEIVEMRKREDSNL